MSHIFTFAREDSDYGTPDQFATYVDAVKSSLLRDNSTAPCKGGIGTEFMDQTLNGCHYLIVNQKESTPTTNPEILGFVCLFYYLDDEEKTYLYVDLICNNNVHHYNLRAKSLTGTKLLDEVKKVAERLECSYIKLSAIEPVITYYWKLGYRFSVGDDSKGATRVNTLFKAQKALQGANEDADAQEQAKKAYEDVLIHHTEGIMKDDGRSREQKLSVQKDNGIIMKLNVDTRVEKRGRDDTTVNESSTKRAKTGGKRKGMTKRKKQRKTKQTRRRRKTAKKNYINT